MNILLNLSLIKFLKYSNLFKYFKNLTNPFGIWLAQVRVTLPLVA